MNIISEEALVNFIDRASVRSDAFARDALAIAQALAVIKSTFADTKRLDWLIEHLFEIRFPTNDEIVLAWLDDDGNSFTDRIVIEDTAAKSVRELIDKKLG